MTTRHHRLFAEAIQRNEMTMSDGSGEAIFASGAIAFAKEAFNRLAVRHSFPPLFANRFFKAPKTQRQRRQHEQVERGRGYQPPENDNRHRAFDFPAR